MILGLETPTGGQALINGRPYRTLRDPLRAVGACQAAMAAVASRALS
jgi:ABC-2 type transport system ATP-binding protein